MSARDGEARRPLRRWLTLAVDQSPASVMITDLRGRIEYVNEKFTEITGYSEEEAIGRSAALINSGNTPPAVYESLWETIRSGGTWEGELENRGKDGELYWDRVRISPIRGESGEIEHYLSIQEDVTRQKRTEAVLRNVEEMFRQFAETVNEALFVVDVPDGDVVYVNPAFEEIWGIPVEELYAHPFRWYEAVHPSERHVVEASMARTDAGEPNEMTYRIIRPNGGTRCVRSRTFPVFGETGRVRRVVGLAEDITEQREAQRRLEQAQRMEAAGRLAGGVAHDFNNLLTVILAEAQLMEADLPAGGAALESLREIVKAGERAAVLTRQMLAFSRRQLIEPSVFSLNDLVVDMESMLRRIIGEDVRLVTHLAPDAGRVEVDRGQIEQVLANLIVNSRDAMPDGGTLTIETANVELDETYTATRDEVRPGEYVKLSVSDTGDGMTKEVRRQAFDPFFTTKPPGKGTGLGLATSYGIVKQSGGHIALYSEPGLGTTVNVYLPRTRSPAGTERSGRDAGVAPGGTETILLVEDELAVRRVAVRALRAKGYTVLEARDGPEALELLQGQEEKIDLLLTDVVLPRLSGRELAEQVEARRPDTRVLFMSGYADDVILQHRLLEDSYELLQKPFTLEALTQKVREVLDRADAGPEGAET